MKTTLIFISLLVSIECLQAQQSQRDIMEYYSIMTKNYNLCAQKTLHTECTKHFIDSIPHFIRLLEKHLTAPIKYNSHNVITKNEALVLKNTSQFFLDNTLPIMKKKIWTEIEIEEFSKQMLIFFNKYEEVSQN